MSVGYTCPGLNKEGTECAVHWTAPRDGLKCRVEGDRRPPVRNTKSERGQLPAGWANVNNRPVGP